MADNQFSASSPRPQQNHGYLLPTMSAIVSLMLLASSCSSTRDPVAPSNPVGARQICAAAFPDVTVLAWADDTVAGLHDYGYGGPQATHPLAGAFVGVADDTGAAWCGTELAQDTIRWWGVVPGYDPVKAIDIQGPGATEQKGKVLSPPLVP